MEDQIVFVTKLRSPSSIPNVRRLIASLRDFGGAVRSCPFFVFTQIDGVEMDRENVHFCDLPLVEGFASYPFGDTVAACAQMESMVNRETHTQVWVDDSCLFVQPPEQLVLGSSWDAALRPVHIRNVGLRPDDQLDNFWKGIHLATGSSPSSRTVESFIDRQILRPYFNSHSFAINPHLGLMAAWVEHFRALVNDREFQKIACIDELHQVFLFQALLSVLLTRSIPWHRMRILPSNYNYPLHLLDRIPEERRPRRMNDLVSLTDEGGPLDPRTYTGMAISEPLRTWLIDHAIRSGI